MTNPTASLRSDYCPICAGIGVRQLSESVSDFIGIRRGATHAYDAAIAQFGLIPLGTESLLFKAYEPRNPFMVEVGGQAIEMFKLSEENGHNLYGGDISLYAGQSLELRITNPSVFGRPSNLFLDSITFSTMQVPEPGVLGLVALGGAALLFRRWMVTRR